MQLTHTQAEYIAKQYRRYLDKKITLKQCNQNLQKYFNVDKDFTKIIIECEYFNKGSYDIGWALLDV